MPLTPTYIPELTARTGAASLRRAAERALDWLNVLLSDVRYGLGAYLGVYLMSEHRWDVASVGWALSIGGFVSLLVQTAIGAFVDVTRAKRCLLAAAIIVATAANLAIPWTPGFAAVALACSIGALGGSAIGPAVSAISLGIVGAADFARRVGRNEALFHLGNAGLNLIVLATAWSLGNPVLFWLMGATALASLIALAFIPSGAIDHVAARGLLPGSAGPQPSFHAILLRSRPLLLFGLSGALFHLANGALLGLIAQKLALGDLGHGVALTAACAIAAQVVMVPTAALAGHRADAWGRKPLLLIGFAAVALRAALVPLSDHPAWLIGVQLLDGLGAGMIGALFPVIVADLTRGSGHFNAAAGTVGTIHLIGGMMSAALAGTIAATAGYGTAFLTLSAIAVAGAVLFALAMPETRDLAPAAHRPAERE